MTKEGLPNHWVWIENKKDKRNLERELWCEVAHPYHLLYGERVEAVAQLGDDVLFQVEDGRYVAVHLSWPDKPKKSPDWPDARLYPSLEAFRADWQDEEDDSSDPSSDPWGL